MARVFTSAGNDFIVTAKAATPTTLHSWSAWVNVTAFGAVDGRVYEWRDAAGTSNEDVQFYHPGASDIFEYSGTWSGGGGQWTCPAPAAGVWVHAAFTYDASATGNDPLMYLNGVSQTVTRVAAPVGALNTFNTTMTFGQRFGGSGNKYNGYLGPIAIWSSILTQTDISFLAAGQDARKVSAATLVRHFPMLGTGLLEYDTSVNGDTGAITGTSFTADPKDFLQVVPAPGPYHPGKGPTNARFTKRFNNWASPAAVAASTTKFRKTLSSIGTRTGSRQLHNT